MSTPLRAGLVGSGPWAAMVHAPGLDSHVGVQFTHLWARNAEAGARLARRYGVERCASYDDLLDAVDLVSLCVPPEVQGGLAVAARERGRLVLLEKPIADAPERARAIAAAGSPASAPSVVNYSLLLDDSVQPWLEAATGRVWASGRVVVTNDVLLTDGPFAASPWRQAEHAGLWDLGPHAISLLAAVLGPVVSVGARADDDVITVSCAHGVGTRSEVVCSLSASPRVGLEFRDADGRREAPVFTFDASRAYANALTALVHGPTAPGQRVASALDFSAHVVDVIAAAAESLAAGGREVDVAGGGVS